MRNRTGRPPGSGIDDEAVLDAVEAARRLDPALSQRGAVIAQVGDEPSLVRRIERKLTDRARTRAGDVRMLGAKPFTPAPARSTEAWSCLVEVPVDGHDGFAVAHSEVVGLPVLVVVRDGVPVSRGAVPEHHVLRAVDALSAGHGWDDPGYRACCTTLGIDPDLGRQHLTPRLERVATRFRDAVLAGDLEDFGELDVIGTLAGVRRPQGRSPYALARLHASYEGDASPEAVAARAEARAAFAAVDWPRSQAYTTLQWLAGPFGYDHHASICFFGNERDGLGSVSGDPEILAPPDAEDWVGVHAARLTERHCMAVTLSPEEMQAFSAGGDRGYWLASRDWGTRPLARALAEINRPDLTMTHAILDAMTASAYAMYEARATGTVLRADAPLSHETRVPLEASSPRTRYRCWTEAARRGLRELLGLVSVPPRWKASRETLWTRWGEVAVTREGDRVLVRSGRFPLEVGKASVRLTCEFVPAFDWRGLPEIHQPWFEMADLRAGKPLPSADALPVLRTLSWAVCAEAGLPGYQGRVIPVTWLTGLRLAALALALVTWVVALAAWQGTLSMGWDPQPYDPGLSRPDAGGPTPDMIGTLNTVSDEPDAPPPDQ